MTAEDRRSHIEEIRLLPAALEDVLADMNNAQLDTSYRDGGWSARQVAHHLADSHVNAYIRMKLIVTEDYPTLKPYDQDSWAVLSDSAMPLDATLSLLRGLHERWAFFLESLPEESWSRTAYHPENGDVTLESLLKTYSEHGGHHVEQIRKVKGENS